ncbi:MAG: phosphoribosylformylglycinamidine synthase subunit PurS, partial [Spirochaetales bacterium]
MRIECSVRPDIPDGRSDTLSGRIARSAADVRARVLDVYLIDDRYDPDEAAGLLADPVTTEVTINGRARDVVDPQWTHAVEITVKPGVTDPVAATVDTALEDLDVAFVPVRAQTARQLVFHAPNLPLSRISALCRRLYNPLIQYASIIVRDEERSREVGTASEERPPEDHDDAANTSLLPVVHSFPADYPRAGTPPAHTVTQIALDHMDSDQLASLNRDRLLALNSAELCAIRDFFARPDVIARREEHGLSGATDVELEMLAQTWSEHCKHKIFSSQIDVDGRFAVDGLFRRCIAAVTDSLAENRDDLLSVFDDNSGVVRFDDEYAVCFKAETHNSPSALDPYGGAITGIVGVNRDILGTGRGARPIFNTNVLCFADPACPDEEVPPSLLPPGRVLEGVHEGIVDGGNQSGIPVVAGAFLFDDSYLGKPLVFCGTGGMLPNDVDGTAGWHKGARPGDVVVMVGGRIGKDGIHGATFSSLALDETSPTSAVQIGDPITQKKMIDFLLEARDEGLMSSLTDNGAGGLSSSLGEMARESGGIHVDLERCPLKYEGLAPWEIWVSESQERMSAAVPPE